MPIPLIAIAAAAGLLKGMTIDAQKEKRDKELAAETQRLSPWTGLKAGPIQYADPVGSAMSFGLAGHQIQQGMNQDALNQKLADKFLASGNSPQVALNIGAGGGGYGGPPGYSVGNAYGMYGNPWGGVRNYGF